MASIKAFVEKLSPKQRQYAMLALIGLGGFGLLWLVLVLSASNSSPGIQPGAINNAGSTPVNIGVMPPGQQVNPVDRWVGTAGRKLSQYEQDREQQEKINKDRKAFEERTMQRFAEMEQKLLSEANSRGSSPSGASAASPAPAGPQARPTAAPNYPPPSSLPAAGSLPPPPPAKAGHAAGGSPPGTPGLAYGPDPAVSALVRVTLADGSKTSPPGSSNAPRDSDAKAATLDTYLPVSFTRGVLLGGLDAPTGGQSQSNPHPVLIRLSDNSVLPNRYRAEYRECFVIAAGYGDISSERAYLRTENLSCVRNDGTTLEVKIQGTIYGEDGKVGMRGRLVTKQGQMLANALLAGIVGGIGQAFASYNATLSSSAFGTVATQSGSDALRAGVGNGVSRALDRLAQYYIKLAEQTFPVIEVDAGREIDVVITKGARIDGGSPAKTRPTSSFGRQSPDERYLRVSDDEDN